jgi:phosphonopyruvate decarboxylase
MTVSGRQVVALLEARGVQLCTGVPCSLIEDVIAVLETHPGVPYIPAVREDAAVGLAAGAWLGGRRPAVLMQNSGLGTSLNALASLSLMYGLPALLVITWRGWQGKDAPEHILTGAITPRLLDLLGIPHRVLGPDPVEDAVAWAVREMDARMQPVALVVPPGVVETGKAHAPGGVGGPAAAPAGGPDVAARAPQALPAPRVSRLAAIAAAVKTLDREPVVHANGYICRESFSVGDRGQNFYMIGSMGMASAIGLGLALARPGQRAVVFDGDGNLLMNLGILAMIGGRRPPELVHVVFDNEVYGSTGNQQSPSRQVRLDALAAAAGYRTVAAVAEPADVADAVRTALATDGPHFVLVKVTAEEAEVPRIPFTPAAIRDRFRASIAGA